MNAIQAAAAKIDRYNATHNEGGYGYNPYMEEHDKAVAEAVEARIQHIIANVETYKAAWNAEVQKHITKDGIPASAIRKIEAAVGVTVQEMQTVKSRMA